MTQSDAPNEGRLHTSIEYVRGKVRACFSIGSQKFSICEVDTKKEAEWFLDMLSKAFDEYFKIEFQLVRDQLSKEREEFSNVRKSFHELNKKLMDDNIELQTNLRDGREMRKELVENAIATLCSKFPEYGNREFSVREIRALLEPLKASELDKT